MPKNLHKFVSCCHKNCTAKKGKPVVHIRSDNRSRYPDCNFGPCECSLESCKENYAYSKIKR